MHASRDRFAEAEPLLRRALEISEQRLGPDHPHTALALTRLGSLFQREGKLAGAERLLTRALTLRQAATGSGSPQTAEVLAILASCYVAMGRYTEAATAYRNLISNQESRLGLDDPAVARSLNRLADVYLAGREPSRAQPLYERAFGVLGPADPNMSLDNYIQTLRQVRRPADAQRLQGVLKNLRKK
jgi:tetratricopeptide (TPR) repeat protein